MMLKFIDICFVVSFVFIIWFVVKVKGWNGFKVWLKWFVFLRSILLFFSNVIIFFMLGNKENFLFVVMDVMLVC